jgi:hypothetical protein
MTIKRVYESTSINANITLPQILRQNKLIFYIFKFSFAPLGKAEN